MKEALPRHIIDSHRHPIGTKLREKLAAKGVYNASEPLPQTNDQDIFVYREFIDLDYAITKQRDEGVTLSILSNGGELDWIAKMMGMSVNDTMSFLADEYQDIMSRYPKEFVPMINAHALEQGCRGTLERLLKQTGSHAVAVSSSYGTGAEREFLDSPKAEWLWEFAASEGLVVHIHPPMMAYGSEALMLYRLNEALGRPFDSTVNASRMIASGVFDRHPALQVVIVHMGGDLLSVLGRLDFNWRLNYKGIRNPPTAKVMKNVLTPASYFRSNIIVDTMGFNKAAIRAAVDVCGVDRVILGTDYGPVPFGVAEHIDDVCAVATSDEERDSILWSTSKRLFKLNLTS